MELLGQVGPGQYSDGVAQPLRVGKAGEVIMGEMHGRFYEQCYRNALFSIGSSTTALSATTVGLTASSTPIVGVWNPTSSGKNLVILQASLQVSIQAASSTAPGSFVWASSVGNAVITTGSAPFNRQSLTSTGSVAKGFPGGVALTGLTNSLVIFEGADLHSGLALSTTTVAASTVVQTVVAVQNFDGSLIVPPGGVLALLNTVNTSNLSVASRLMWEEVIL